MKNKIYYIKWCDATSNIVPWWTKDEAITWADNELWQVEIVGWLLKKTNKYILIASKKSIDSDNETQYGQLFKIPTTWIIEIKEVK